MKFNKWTVGLATVGVVSLASAARADEQMSMVNTALSQTTLSGYVDTAAQWSPGTDQNAASVEKVTGPFKDGQNIPNYAFAKDDGFSLNAIDIALDKPEDSSAWAAGYHVELMGGPDSVGIGAGTDDAIRQAFIRLHTPVGGNGIDWQVGVFDNIIGYESNSDPLNPNYTRSYGYSIEPTTMTGILGTYKVNDEISISGGVADIGDGLGLYGASATSTSTYESQKAYMGSINLTAPDSMGFLKGATATLAAVHGENSIDAAAVTSARGSTTSWYAGVTLPTPITPLKVGACLDYVQEADVTGPTDAPTGVKGGDDVWVAGLYATYQATANLSFNARGEYFDDGSNPADVVSLYPGNKGEELTATIQYSLWANVMTRAEFRWDHVEHGDQFGANSTTGDEEGFPDKNNDFLLALNVIYQF